MSWVNGNPIPAYAPPRDNIQLTALARAALSLEYEPKTITELDPITGESIEVIDPKEEKYVGHTTGEVIYMRAAQSGAEGDLDAASFVSDRVMGKPKQFSEMVTINVSLAQALDEIADKMDAEKATVVDVIPHPEWSVLD